MRAVKIIRVRFLEDDIFEGSLHPDIYDRAIEEVIPVADVNEAVSVIAREGLTFAASGAGWAAHPDGSYVINYATGEREETSAHFEGEWTDEDMGAVALAVG